MTVTGFTLFAGCVRIPGDKQLRSHWSTLEGFVITYDGATVQVGTVAGVAVFALGAGYLTLGRERPPALWEKPLTQEEAKVRDENAHTSGAPDKYAEARSGKAYVVTTPVDAWEDKTPVDTREAAKDSVAGIVGGETRKPGWVDVGRLSPATESRKQPGRPKKS